ncbi:hypothetical protein NEOLI_000528 [Neolecta irregularis DAH-3]|uniref:Uncharacterized protein n=1 Tax=Neolecta irregularis (strain DAH-3) TaxID=1198029 RepID=A0A1U7LSB3_NEOID|nr:hypothetical protein NEOLI_000528 [Neolecta irregularis DAH-3]|eukprot:OLL25432.1 hypothetical protein NEOLI_000528 [Neolecta irregularis DAH-3]
MQPPSLRKLFQAFTPSERKNIIIYVLGIMLYKFGLEAFTGSIITLATDRFNSDHTFTKLGALTGLYQAMQCVGAILIAPLIMRFSTKAVLACTVLIFGCLTTLLMIIDASTGGKIQNATDSKPTYGRYTPNIIFPIYCSTGVCYGMVELIRRIIPRDLVGGNVQKLRRLDALVHVFYEVSGTTGAFTSAWLILRLGNNYALLITPIFFVLSCVTWSFLNINSLSYRPQSTLNDSDAEAECKSVSSSRITVSGYSKQSQPRTIKKTIQSYFGKVLNGFCLFFKSIYMGAGLVMTSRKFIWLFSGYSIALYAHRYLENALLPAFANRTLGESAYSQIMVGGSNFGELLGALSVFLLSNSVPTPMPWLRLDALMLLITWVLVFIKPAVKDLGYVWKLALMFVPISFGWAAGDVSLAAYIQASLSRIENVDHDISALGSVMAFLYCSYIIIYAILSSLLGGYIDAVWSKYRTIRPALLNISGVQFTVIACVIFASTFIPRGSCKLNPKILEGEDLENDDLMNPTEI